MNTQNVIDHLEQGLPMNARLKREIVRRLKSYKFNEDCADAALRMELAESQQRVKALEGALSRIISVAERCDSWESFPATELEAANKALEVTCQK